MVRARYWEKPKDNENVTMFMQKNDNPAAKRRMGVNLN
jgi:hypothetical protein